KPTGAEAPQLQNLTSPAEFSEEHGDRVVEFVDDTLLERNDGVVGDVNFFGADFGAALGDVAVAEAEFVLEERNSVCAVERMHFEAGGTDEEARSAERFVLLMIAEHVADVLAKKAFNAFAKFLDTVDVALIHFPFDILARLEGGDFLVDLVVRGDIGDEVFDNRKRLER